MSRLHQDIVFRNPQNDGFIIVNASVVRQMDKHRQIAGHHCEAGGILMGLRRGRHLEVTIATTPKREDKRTRIGFERISPFHQKFAVRAWRRLEYKLDYVGEWHTHPENSPRPSGIDKAEWAKLIRLNKRELLFIIVGISDTWVGMSRRGGVAVESLPAFTA